MSAQDSSEETGQTQEVEASEAGMPSPSARRVSLRPASRLVSTEHSEAADGQERGDRDLANPPSAGDQDAPEPSRQRRAPRRRVSEHVDLAKEAAEPSSAGDQDAPEPSRQRRAPRRRVSEHADLAEEADDRGRKRFAEDGEETVSAPRTSRPRSRRREPAVDSDQRDAPLDQEGRESDRFSRASYGPSAERGERGERGPRRPRQKRRRPDSRGGSGPDEAPAQKLVDEPPLVLSELRTKTIDELLEIVQEAGMQAGPRPRPQDLLEQIARGYAMQARPVLADGVLEVMNDGFGFLRQAAWSYAPGPEDAFVPVQLARRWSLQTGDEITGLLRPMRGNERHCAIQTLQTINGESPSNSRQLPAFESLTPLFPQERLKLESGNGSKEDIAPRIIDLVSPIGKGQRGLIVSPPKAGKTIILQNIARSIESNNKECELIVLLIDERPEEVTEMRRSVRARVIASTFDEPATRHVQAAEIVIGQARRRVEQGADVVILLDSITRLARAYNTVQPSSGRILTGGVDANALERPKRFFGAARKIENGGSLTIIATALVETGSRMDEVIYEEFKGTGNMELHLERRIAEKRLFPAINLRRSSTRREELLLEDDRLQRIFILRKLLHSMDDLPAMEFLLERLKATETNDQFFEAMRRG